MAAVTAEAKEAARWSSCERRGEGMAGAGRSYGIFDGDGAGSRKWNLLRRAPNNVELDV
jgi:hypothetical protein